jgi:PBP1b-binding outer membrane lipoprotein LpoB
MTRIAGLLLVVLLLAGCGQGDTTAMNHKFEQLDFKLAGLETINSQYNQQHFAQLTQKYIALVHRYEGQLGKKEARRRLVELGDELNSYCLPCTGVLYIEARKI